MKFEINNKQHFSHLHKVLMKYLYEMIMKECEIKPYFDLEMENINDF